MSRGIALADGFVAVGADFKAYDAALNRKATETRGTLGRLGAAVKSDMGMAMGAAAGSIATAALKVGETWDSAFDTMRTSTGKTGAALEALNGDLRGMAGTVEDSIGVQAQVLADLNKRTGQTGQSLRDLAKAELDLARITGTDVNRNVAASTRLFGDWSIASGDQAATLDKLYRASTATGIGVDTLMEKVVQFGSPMRLLGFSFEDSIALLGKWEKEGVNTETAMSGLKYAVKTLAAEGVPAADMAATLQERIAAIGKSSDPVGDSLKLFGLRAGPDLAAAIQEGRFSTEDLLAVIEGGSDTIAQATTDTEDFGSAWAKAMNGASAAIGPFLAGAGDIASTIGPLLYTLPLLGGAIGKFAGRLGTKGIRGFTSALETLYLKGLMLGDVFKGSRFATALSDGIGSAIEKVGSTPRVAGALDKVGDAMGSTLGKAVSVAFAAVAVFELYQTWQKVSADLRAQAQGISADVANQIATGSVEALKQSRAALLQGYADTLKLGGLGVILSAETRGIMERDINALTAEIDRRAAGLGPAVASGIASGAPAVEDAAGEMFGPVFTEAQKAEGKARTGGEAVPKAIGEGILARQALVVDAMDRLKFLMENILTRRQEVARAAGILTSKRLAQGLNDGRPAVRAAAKATQTQAEADLARLVAGGGRAGEKAGHKLAQMLKSTNPAVRESARRVKAAAAGILESTKVPAATAGTNAGNAFAAALRKAVASGDFHVNASVGFSIPGRAVGGPVAAGQAYWVNEDTPRSEVYVPSESGQILTHADAMAALRNGGGGGVSNVTNVYNTPLAVQGALPVRTIRDLQREMERIGDLGVMPARALAPMYRRREAASPS